MKFQFEELEIWQVAVEFANEIINLTETIQTDRKHYRLIEQIESASASVSQNIAEGKGRYSKKEFVQFLYIARGSLYETITLLHIFHKKGWIEQVKLDELKIDADKINKMLSSLINSIRSSIK